MNPTRKTGVHPISNVVNGRIMTKAEEAQRDAAEGIPLEHQPEGKTVVVGTDGQIYPTPRKLTQLLIKAFEDSIAEVPDAPIEMHIGCCGINRDTYFQWRKLGKQVPDSIYGEFVRRIEEAMFASWKKLHAMAASQKPFEVLLRRHRELYPSEAMQMQLTGAEGQPLFSGENAFTVRIELHAPEASANRQLAADTEPEFRVVGPDGSKLEETGGNTALGG
jgi:hypothetical protein